MVLIEFYVELSLIKLLPFLITEYYLLSKRATL